LAQKSLTSSSSDKLERLSRVFSLCIMASKREVQKAEQQADAVVQSLRQAGEAAVATTLAGITDVLKKDRPLMYHISALLHNQEWKAVLVASALGDIDVEASADGAKPDKTEQKLRVGISKFQQLARHL
jgi:site-specific recombinase